jgi:hypothetical protein
MNKMDQPHLVARALAAWLCVIGAVLVYAFYDGDHSGDDDDASGFFACGPSAHLELLGVPIHTWPRYCGVVLYTILSTCFRTLHSEVLSPWIVTRVQTTDDKSEYTHQHALPIVMTSVVFTWLDWFMYLNILLAQFDFLLVEVAGNVAVTVWTTRSYMTISAPYAPLS